VLKSFVKPAKVRDIYHVPPPRCLSTFINGTPINKKQKGSPPDKHNNILFAERLMLEMNVLASNSSIFPPGLGELIYDHHLSTPTPFDGMTVRTITAVVDSFLGCDESSSIDADSTVYLSVVQNVSGVFLHPSIRSAAVERKSFVRG
jgi:hypothetical protein